MTTLDQIRNIISLNKEVFGIETTLDMIKNGNYVFMTSNPKTIERTFYLVQDELKLIADTEERVKEEFKGIAVAIAVTSLVIGICTGMTAFIFLF